MHGYKWPINSPRTRTGHLPGVRDNADLIGQRMGATTAGALYDQAMRQHSALGPSPRQPHIVPKILGPQRETGGPAVLDHVTGQAHHVDEFGRSLGQGEKLPGYSGFVPGART